MSGHSPSNQVGGQLDAGFTITGFDEARFHQEYAAKHLPAYYATRAMKPERV